MFGLLHGLGFAAALSDIGLPEASAVPALFLFNVGIEIGQLAIVAVALGFVGLIQRSHIRVGRPGAILPLYVAGSIASYWFIDRTMQIVL
jgi:presenilin-like A22 family membrane protease